MKERLSILWLKTGPLHPLDTGGKIRSYNMLVELRKRHRITYISLAPKPADSRALDLASEYSDEQIWIPWSETPKRSPKFFIQLFKNFFFSRRAYVIDKYDSPEMANQIRELDESGKFDLIICDFLTPAVNLFSSRSRLKTPSLLFQHNVESLIWKRLYENATGFLRRNYFHGQWKRMESFERESCNKVDSVAGVSEDDCQLMRSELGLTNVIGSVPTGVNLSYFCPSATRRRPHSLVFLGSMDWMPNMDAADYFVEKIFPTIKERYADSIFTILGRNPPQRIKDFAKPETGIFVTGTVADVRPHLAEAEILIVPLRIGGGTRIKIYEGMATGTPIVSSTIGAEGLPVTHRENIFLADSPEDFATAICEMFEQPALRQTIGENGRALVERHFSWESATKIFEQYCLRTAARSVK
jgi:polysaccharide biosynthesis protein PslH